MNIKLFRILTGEEVIAELLSEDESTVTIQNGLVVLPTSSGTVGFAPWATVIDRDNPELVVSKSHIVYIASVDSAVESKYNDVYGSKLVTPEKKKLII
jgi:hypothetical protein